MGKKRLGEIIPEPRQLTMWMNTAASEGIEINATLHNMANQVA